MYESQHKYVCSHPLCWIAQNHADPHSSLSALMMCASAGPLQAQWGPVYQHSCPGYRSITQCQFGPHWVSVCLQNCATDRGRNWSLVKRASPICHLRYQQDISYVFFSLSYLLFTCSVLNKNNVVAAPQQLLFIPVSSQGEQVFTVFTRVIS